MSLKQRIETDLKDAMKQGDAARKRALRTLMTAISRAERAGDTLRELSDEDIIAIIAKEAKQREESIEAYEKGGRMDLVAEEKAELEVLRAYLPRQLTREEIEARAREVIAQVGASGPRDMGKVMKVLMAEMRGRADGRLVSQIVRELLAEQK
ncbi:MAG: GatB/YqeY domain-containing protein [Chloroflexi bacterium]|nr:GatB/YqeY domain-containing protein [Chloroflexota bacterium]